MRISYEKDRQQAIVIVVNLKNRFWGRVWPIAREEKRQRPFNINFYKLLW
jgi:hypothetical protein